MDELWTLVQISIKYFQSGAFRSLETFVIATISSCQNYPKGYLGRFYVASPELESWKEPFSKEWQGFCIAWKRQAACVSIFMRVSIRVPAWVPVELIRVWNALIRICTKDTPIHRLWIWMDSLFWVEGGGTSRQLCPGAHEESQDKGAILRVGQPKPGCYTEFCLTTGTLRPWGPTGFLTY